MMLRRNCHGVIENKEENMENAKIVNLYDLSQTIAGEYLSQFTYPWEALKGISDFIREKGPTLDPAVYEKRGEEIWVAKSAKVAPTALLNGPLIIDEDAEIRHCAFIRGSAIIGKGSVVGNSTEIKNDIIFNSVQVPHYNYVGDSILGYKSHMGAGSITSNVKSDKTLVVVKDHLDFGEEIETGLKKFGAMLGDYVEVGCNSVLNPGTVIGRGSRVYPLSSVRGVIPPDHIYKDAKNVISTGLI
jgi:NDP-sugar pyrophosphorylase family protein